MQIKLTESVGEKLRKISERLNMPMAQVVNMLCNEYNRKKCKK